MAKTTSITVGKRKLVRLELEQLKEVRKEFALKLQGMDLDQRSLYARKLSKEFNAAANYWYDRLAASAMLAGVASRVQRAIFRTKARVQKAKWNILAGVAKRAGRGAKLTQKGGLKIEWRDHTSKAGKDKGKLVAMSLATAFNQGNKRIKATNYFDNAYTAARPKVLQMVIEAYRSVIDGK